MLRCVADRSYTQIQLINARRFIQARTLGDLEEMLAPHGFIRLNHSDLVNRSTIDHLDGGSVVLKDGERITVSRRRLADVKKMMAS